MFRASRFINLIAIAAMLAAAIGVSSLPVAAQTSRTDAASSAAYIPGEVVVMFAQGKDLSAYTAQATALAGTVNAQVASISYNMALLSFPDNADVKALSAQLSSQAGVVAAGPNYVYGIPENKASYPDLKVTPSRPAATTSLTRRISVDGKDTTTSIPIKVLKAMQTKTNGKINYVVPFDPLLFGNWGWFEVGADIVWPTTKASKEVCELDTGVDYTHPDLVGKIVKGYDFVNNDANPMDDDGHGTHVAGIIAADLNNGQGIAGVSTGKVLAVKVLNAQGWGSDYNIAQGITYCANTAGVKVLSMSLGGSAPSTVMQAAINYAVNTKGLLLVAAAGNDGSTTPEYPGGYSDPSLYPQFAGEVISVAAEDDGSTSAGYGCMASYSNYGTWVSVAAPGTNILSTLPWSTPFYLGYYYNFYSGYDYLSGTSMATPFVAAVAARRWGFSPSETNTQISSDIETGNPYSVNADGTCWPTEMSGKQIVNVAAQINRAAVGANVFNATTGLPLPNSWVWFVDDDTYAWGESWIPNYPTASEADFIDLPSADTYSAEVSNAAYTNSWQWAYFHQGGYAGQNLIPGVWNYWFTGIPNKTANFALVAGWKMWGLDLDTNVWLPTYTNPLDSSQPGYFIVGPEGDTYGYAPAEGDPTGTLMDFPFAIWNRDGGFLDWLPIESTTIRKRAAHGSLLADGAAPWYPGDYVMGITDYGQPLIGSETVLDFAQPYAYVWKNGTMLDGGYSGVCGTDSWYPFTLSSGVSGSTTISWSNLCSDVAPYAAGFSAAAKGSGASINGKLPQFPK